MPRSAARRKIISLIDVDTLVACNRIPINHRTGRDTKWKRDSRLYAIVYRNAILLFMWSARLCNDFFAFVFFSFVFVRAVRQFRSWNGSDLQLSITGRIIVVLWLENMFPNIEWYICLLPGLACPPCRCQQTKHHTTEKQRALLLLTASILKLLKYPPLFARSLDAWLCLADQHQSRARTDTYDTRKIWACEYKRNTA